MILMGQLTQETRMSLAGLIRDVIQNSPPLTHIDLKGFSAHKDTNESAGEIIMEALLNS